MKAFSIDSENQFQQIVDEVRSLCKKVGIEKEYIFKANRVSLATASDSKLTDEYTIEFNFKDYPEKVEKALDNLEKQIAKAKYKDAVLIDASYIPNIGDEYDLFTARKLKINLTTPLAKKKSKE